MKNILILLILIISLPSLGNQEILHVRDLRHLLISKPDIAQLVENQSILLDSMGLLFGGARKAEFADKIPFARVERIPLEEGITLGKVLRDFFQDPDVIAGVRPEAVTVKIIRRHEILSKRYPAFTESERKRELAAGDIILLQYLGEW